MKLKLIKNLKTDISGLLSSNFKVCRSLKDVKSNIYFKLNKNLKRKKIRRNSIFDLKILISKVRSRSSFSSTPVLTSMPNSKRNNQSSLLDFNSSNTKNVFLRTKRKSSYGQTLLEKQKLKFYMPFINEKVIKKYFINKNISIGGLSSLEHYNTIFSRLDYALNASNVFISSDFIKGQLILKKNFFSNEILNVHSYDSINLKYNFPKLYCSKNKQNNLKVFNRVVPNNIFHDIRLNKLKVLNKVVDFKLPFKFNMKKVVQHYRLKRN